MRLRVLGCSGGELPRHRTTCFLVDGSLAIDAGALTASLPLEELLRGGRHRPHPLALRPREGRAAAGGPPGRPAAAARSASTPPTPAPARCAESVFNGELWPDFTRIPDRRRPVLRIVPFDSAPAVPRRAATRSDPSGEPPGRVGGLPRLRRAGHHRVSGDTGPTDAFWQAVNTVPRLSALLRGAVLPELAAVAGGPLRPPHAADAARRAGQAGAGRVPGACCTTTSPPTWRSSGASSPGYGSPGCCACSAAAATTLRRFWIQRPPRRHGVVLQGEEAERRARRSRAARPSPTGAACGTSATAAAR